jgi:hypothetical protein
MARAPGLLEMAQRADILIPFTELDTAGGVIGSAMLLV